MEFHEGDRVLVIWPGSIFLGNLGHVQMPTLATIFPNTIPVKIDNCTGSCVSYQEKDLLKIPKSCTDAQLRALRSIVGVGTPDTGFGDILGVHEKA